MKESIQDMAGEGGGYDEQRFRADVYSRRMANLSHFFGLLSQTREEQQTHEWIVSLARHLLASDESDWEWVFLHEFPMLMPGGADRESGVASANILEDLDHLIREYPDADLKFLYMRMRNLGYSARALHTKEVFDPTNQAP
ncbi:MAG: hypothetical protein PHZ00_01955 [Candidatus Peribacteraceae bacterium]|nr:hypothetical protein [Candidatus Peribacteraceae bacterium]